MGYFDGLADAVFKKDASGNNLFYPWGVLGAGYIIESEEKKNQIRGFYKKMYMVMLPAIIIIQVAVGFWPNLILLPIYYVWYYFSSKKMTKGLKKSSEKLGLLEAYKNSAKSHNLPTLIILELVSLGFLAAGIWLLSIGLGSVAVYFCVAFAVLCVAAIGYMIFAKINDR